jgi:hypothetical protein
LSRRTVDSTKFPKTRSSMLDSRIESQMIFNTVVRHLAQQKRRAGAAAGGSLMCSYRTWDGLTCAVGCLFTEEEYQVRFEGKPVHRLLLDGILQERLRPHVALLASLQEAHDKSETLKVLKGKLRSIAGMFLLSATSVPTIMEWEY